MLIFIFLSSLGITKMFKPSTLAVSAARLSTFSDLVLAEQANKSIYSDPFFFMKVLEQELSKALTDTELELIENMKAGGQPGIVHITGLPREGVLPRGDSAIIRNENKTRMSESLILTFAALLGCYLYSKKTEQDGVIFHNISPVKGQENVISSVGLDPFYYHTEIAYSQDVPKFLMLLCLEPDSKAKTSYFSVETILAGIPERIKEIMRKPVFKISAVKGYDSDEITCALLSVDPETMQETFRFYQHVPRIEVATQNEDEKQEADECLCFLTEYAKTTFPASGEEPAVGLEAGEALLFNNGWGYKDAHHGVMHGRVGHIENPNRWLQRGYFFAITPQIKEQINMGYWNFLIHLLEKNQTYSLKLATACLKTAIENSMDYKQSVQDHPEYTISQHYFHGIKPKTDALSKKENWLKRIATTDNVSQSNPSLSSNSL